MISKEIHSAIALISSELATHGKLELGPEAAQALIGHLAGAVDQAMVLEATPLMRPCCGTKVECAAVRALAVTHITRGTKLTPDQIRAFAYFVIAHEQAEQAAARNKRRHAHG